MTTGSVADVQRSGQPSTSRAQETVQAVQEVFEHSPHKSTCQAAQQTVLKELNWCVWKPHYYQSLLDEDCDIHMEFGKICWLGMKSGPICSTTFSGVMRQCSMLEALSTATTATTGQERILIL